MLASDLPNQQEIPELNYLTVAYDDFVAGRIKYREFVEQCIKWSYHYAFCKGEYLPELVPGKPFALMQFDSLKPTEAKAMSDEALAKIKALREEYLEKAARSRNKNRVQRDWLQKMASYFRYKEDSAREEEINRRLKLYEGAC